MSGSEKQKERINRVIDLRHFDKVIQDELTKHPAWNIGELSCSFFFPSLYQMLAIQLSEWGDKHAHQRSFSTKCFRSAYQYEDRNEILDELGCQLKEYLAQITNVPYFEYGIQIRFITHNIWAISYEDCNDSSAKPNFRVISVQ